MWQYVGEDDGVPAFQNGKYYHHIKPRYHVGEVVYIKEAWATDSKYDELAPRDIPRDSAIWYKTSPPPPAWVGRWRSPLHLPVWAAHYFLQTTDVRPELFKVGNLTAQELEMEGGEEALTILKEYEGKWLWVYQFKLVPRPEQITKGEIK